MRMRRYSQPDQGFWGDNTGMQKLEVNCRGPGMTGGSTTIVTGAGPGHSGSYWGGWSEQCPSGWAACSVKVKLENNHGITDIIMICCEY